MLDRPPRGRDDIRSTRHIRTPNKLFMKVDFMYIKSYLAKNVSMSLAYLALFLSKVGSIFIYMAIDTSIASGSFISKANFQRLFPSPIGFSRIFVVMSSGWIRNTRINL